jgi:peptide deformylase
MLRTIFKTKLEADIYIAEQKIRREKGYLTRSERTFLDALISNPANYIHEVKEAKQGKPIVTSLGELKKPCAVVTKDDDIKSIIKDLKETLACHRGYGISANQIGIQKQISIYRIPIVNAEQKKIEIKERVLINPQITIRNCKYIVRNEGCISFKAVVDTDRWKYITVEYLDEHFNPCTEEAEDAEALVIQHECDHCHGFTIFDRKYKRR